MNKFFHKKKINELVWKVKVLKSEFILYYYLLIKNINYTKIMGRKSEKNSPSN